MKSYKIAHPYLDKFDKKGVLEVLNSGYLSLGNKYLMFERAFSNYCHTNYAITVSNGTCGLHLAVKALNLQKGDEVITTPFSFIASTNCLLYEGITPVFVDIDPISFNINVDLIEKAITSKTKAILVVHIFGQSANMDKVRLIAKKHNLKIIEDACESLGATWKTKLVGTMGDIGVFAFYPNKQLTTGEGGMIVTNKKHIAELCVSLRNQGRNNRNDWLIHERLGYNYRMNEMSASLGITQLKKFNWMLLKRKRIASWYTKHLSLIPNVIVPKILPNSTHTWFVYVIRIQKRNRNYVIKKLNTNGIQAKPYFPVIHLQPYIKKLFNYKQNSFPVAEQVANETIALPFYIGLKENDVRYICSIIHKIMTNNNYV